MSADDVNGLVVIANFLLSKGLLAEDVREELSRRVSKSQTERGKRAVVRYWLKNNYWLLVSAMAQAIIFNHANRPPSEN